MAPQGARGENTGGDFFVENVFEELDYPGEFFHNQSTGQLFLFYNGTGAPPATMQVVAPQLQVLVNMSGTQWDPVKNVKLSGVTYTAAAYTYMERHGVPSAGTRLSACLSVRLTVVPPLCLSGCASVRLPLCLCVCLSVCLSVKLSVLPSCLSSCLSSVSVCAASMSGWPAF